MSFNFILEDEWEVDGLKDRDLTSLSPGDPYYSDCYQCPFFNMLNTVMRKDRIYWAGEEHPEYSDIVYIDSYFCPKHNRSIDYLAERCFDYRKEKS